MRKIKSVLVTGNAGFIGQNMVRCLQRHGIEPYGLEKDDKIDLDLFAKVDAVIHLGAISSTTETNKELLLKNNVEFSKKIYKVCENIRIPFQYASSASVYGDSLITDENTWDYKQKNLYAESKFLFDKWIDKNGYGFYQGFRYFNVFGKPNTEKHKKNQASPISRFFQQTKEKGYVEVFEGSENYKRDFVWVDDLCRAQIYFLENVKKSGIWNIGTGNPISFLDVAKAFQKKYGVEIREISMPENLKAGYQKFTKADLKKFNKELPNFQWTSITEFINFASLEPF